MITIGHGRHSFLVKKKLLRFLAAFYILVYLLYTYILACILEIAEFYVLGTEFFQFAQKHGNYGHLNRGV